MEDGGPLAGHGAQREQANACRRVDHAAYDCLTHRNRAAKVVVPEKVSAGRIESVMMPFIGACIRDSLGDRLYRWPIRIIVGVSVKARCTTDSNQYDRHNRRQSQRLQTHVQKNLPLGPSHCHFETTVRAESRIDLIPRRAEAVALRLLHGAEPEVALVRLHVHPRVGGRFPFNMVDLRIVPRVYIAFDIA